MKNVAVIIRGQYGPFGQPEFLKQHVDVLLSDGTLTGYFADQKKAWLGTGSFGFGLPGIVFSYRDYASLRPFYVDVESAKKASMVSTVCVISVSDEQARKFDEYWTKRSKNTDGFSLIGNNCATHATEAFKEAGILKRPGQVIMRGTETPGNLFYQLRKEHSGNFKCQSGYIGFKKLNGKYELEIQ